MHICKHTMCHTRLKQSSKPLFVCLLNPHSAGSAISRDDVRYPCPVTALSVIFNNVEMSQIMVSTNMPQITVVSMIVEGRLDRLDSFPLLYPLGLMESRSPFPHVQFSQKHLFVSKYSLGTEFLVSPSPLWLLLLRNIPVPGLDWNGAHFQEHAPEHFGP